MKFNWLDLVLALGALVAIIRGYRAGFLKSIFAIFGFVGGGLIGLIVGLHYLNNLSNVIAKFGLLLLAISAGSSIGEWLTGKFAKFFHNQILFGPFKWLDSILGAALSLLRMALISYMVAALCLATPWGWAHKVIPQSEIYRRITKVTPSIIKDVTKEIKSIN